MEIGVKSGDILQEPSDLCMLGVYEDTPLPPEVADLLEPSDFAGKPKQTLLLYPRNAVAPRRLLLVGLGKRDEVNVESMRQAGAIAVKEAQKLHVPAVTVGVHGDSPLAPELAAQSFAEGMELGAYRYQVYRTTPSNEHSFVVESATVFTRRGNEQQVRDGIAIGQIIARGVTFARDPRQWPRLHHDPRAARRGGHVPRQALWVHGDGARRGSNGRSGLWRHPGRRQGLGQRATLHRHGVGQRRRRQADDLSRRQGADL